MEGDWAGRTGDGGQSPLVLLAVVDELFKPAGAQCVSLVQPVSQRRTPDSRASSNQAVDLDRPLLPNAIGAVHRLQVVGRVPIRIEDDDLG